VGALVFARRTHVGVNRVSGAALAYGVALTAMCLAPNVGVALVLGLVLGLTSITFIVSSTAIVQTKAAPEMRGRVLALQAMLFLGSTPVGGPIVGYIAEEYGARWSIALGAAAAIGAGLWGRAAMRGVPTTDGTGYVAVPGSNGQEARERELDTAIQQGVNAELQRS